VSLEAVVTITRRMFLFLLFLFSLSCGMRTDLAPAAGPGNIYHGSSRSGGLASPEAPSVQGEAVEE
jgi:hypothetical protein